MPTEPIDSRLQSKFALEGRVVTMDAADSVLDEGIVYIESDRIVALAPAGAPVPEGFEEVAPVRTGGTIYPGLIDLHNHLSYNALTPLNVPERFTNRGQWSRKPFYQKLITRPMKVLGRLPGYVEAIVRYVECKCLLGGVTTSQGIALFSNQGIVRYYRGIVRNVEETDDPALPEAATRIADVDAESADRFLARLQRSSCLLLHLSEGTDDRARQHFQALQLTDGSWAITDALAGIHCVALKEADFATMADPDHRGAMIWSPLSNLLLYGQTANIKAAKESGIRMGIGSDWSPSGSKNLLGELKVAHLVSAQHGGVFSDRELLAMATRNAANILKWDEVGSIESGKRADLLVIAGRRGDPYSHIIRARETEIILVVINGVPRYGRTRLMDDLGLDGEGWRVGHARRRLHLGDPTADPAVGGLTLGDARDRLQDGLNRLPELERQLDELMPSDVLGPRGEVEPHWFLLLDHDEPAGISLRHHLPFGPGGQPTAPREPLDPLALTMLAEPLEPQPLDALTVADDDLFFDRQQAQVNLPLYVKEGLPQLY
ncbi:MAG: amidohydrolase family protein [Chloroflexota bacterium]|nr:amidohydrolase family protein [Chloroflexota bacterium]